ncbi:hypothetical protein CVT26_015747 [Gymnopilus dilepis]|uniref:Tat pathway signal sequence n=1 Tax=Gymnopilus dilepis TaxID=231916 RepID=A0A409VFM6_9AGAR|nr:hypothetical protein CVT26_015747 [Gymnopilus dilepis]
MGIFQTRGVAPANEAIEYNRELTMFNGTFNFPSEFRGPPTPEIDAAWMRISQGVKPTRLTLEQVLKIGKFDTPSKVKFREEDGGGYMASMEVTHQLHCLNMLRKYTYKEYYQNFDPSFTHPKPDVFRTHLDHCVEILRQHLMCTADVGMITYEWVTGFSEPYPDFNVKHQCRNFEKILDWGYRHAIHLPRDHVASPLAIDDADGEGSSEKLLVAGGVTPPSSSSLRVPWLVHLGVFSLYTIAFLGFFVFSFGQDPERPDDTCFLEHSMYCMTFPTSNLASKLTRIKAPAREAVKYSVVRFNGSLEFASPFKGQPTPALDEAWDRITTNNSLWPIRVSDEDLERIYKGGRASNVKYRELDGGGNMASIEVFHQLHCLNMLRKYTYPKEYPEVQELWKTRPNFMRSHLGDIKPHFKWTSEALNALADHCIDMIRQNLMCASDVGVISYDWISGWEVPFPDFNTYHRCRNFDAILDWAMEHRVRIPQDHMLRTGKEISLPRPPA